MSELFSTTMKIGFEREARTGAVGGLIDWSVTHSVNTRHAHAGGGRALCGAVLQSITETEWSPIGDTACPQCIEVANGMLTGPLSGPSLERRRVHHEPPLYEFGAWLALGVEKGWVTDMVCATHEGIPNVGDEEAAWEDGGDPCQVVLRVLPS